MVSDAQLLELAREAARAAYCPYSKFHVGACVEAEDGSVSQGCNVENASYGLTVCAERAALFRMAVSGERKFRRLAVTCPDAGAESPDRYRMPCGACRQVMAEFAAPGAQIIVDGVGTFSMGELLPKAFTL